MKLSKEAKEIKQTFNFQLFEEIYKHLTDEQKNDLLYWSIVKDGEREEERKKIIVGILIKKGLCLLYTSPSPRD